MPHEIAFDRRGHLYIAERDNHVVRKVDASTGGLSTLAGTGTAGFSGDGGPAARATLRQPHSVAIAPDGRLLICDVGNHRLRAGRPRHRCDHDHRRHRRAPADAGWRAARRRAARRTARRRHRRRRTIFLALREGNAIHRIAPGGATIHHLAGTGAQGYTGDGGPARLATLGGPKGLAIGGRGLFVADTENHAIRRIDLDGGVITTVLGTGTRGDGPDGDPRRCALARPHGVCVGPDGRLYVGDSEAHRIRVLAS
jgi:sugar lactone lactonase YvrE